MLHILCGILYHYLICALEWAATTIEATLTTIDVDVLCGEMKQEYRLLQEKERKYRKLVNELQPNAYLHKGDCSEKSINDATKQIVYLMKDVRASIQMLHTIQCND